jgi:hypothetical protein
MWWRPRKEVAERSKNYFPPTVKEIPSLQGRRTEEQNRDPSSS